MGDDFLILVGLCYDHQLENRFVLPYFEQEYREMIERGKIVYNIIEKGDISVEELSKRNRETLEIYRKQRSTMNYTDIVLRP